MMKKIYSLILFAAMIGGVSANQFSQKDITSMPNRVDVVIAAISVIALTGFLFFRRSGASSGLAWYWPIAIAVVVILIIAGVWYFVDGTTVWSWVESVTAWFGADGADAEKITKEKADLNKLKEQVKELEQQTKQELQSAQKLQSAIETQTQAIKNAEDNIKKLVENNYKAYQELLEEQIKITKEESWFV